MKANARIRNSVDSARKPRHKASGAEAAAQARRPRATRAAETARAAGTASEAVGIHRSAVSRIYGEWIFLCAGLCLSFLVLLTSGDSIRSFSESEGVEALSSSVRALIEKNDLAASFFGLAEPPSPPLHENESGEDADGSEAEDEESAPVFSFTGGLGSAEYVELHNASNYRISGQIPVTGTVSSRYSFRKNPFYGVYADEDEYEFHSGVDIAADEGTEILCYLDGKVESCGLSASYGYYLCVDHGDGLKTLYAHASELLCFEGDEVKRGQPIALVGETGRATGPHLHFEVYENGQTTDPEKYLGALFKKKEV